MNQRRFPAGYRAVHHGKRYVSSAGVGDGRVTLFDEETRREVRAVPISELDEWYRVRTVGTYLGEPFGVDAEIDGAWYVICFDGGNGRKIAEEWDARKDAADGSRYWREDQFTFMATVPKADVHDVREVRVDVLGPWRANLGKVAEAEE